MLSREQAKAYSLAESLLQVEPLRDNHANRQLDMQFFWGGFASGRC